MTTDSITYSDGYRYALQDTCQIQTGLSHDLRCSTTRAYLRDGILTVVDGYAWNGANVIYDRRSVILASLVHDVLVAMVRCGGLPASARPQIDAEFCRQIVAGGGWRWLARLDLLGLRLFSRGAYRRSSEPLVRAAP